MDAKDLKIQQLEELLESRASEIKFLQSTVTHLSESPVTEGEIEKMALIASKSHYNDGKDKQECFIDGFELGYNAAPPKRAVGGMEVKFLKWTTDNKYVWEEGEKRFVAAWDNYKEFTHEELYAAYLSTLPTGNAGEGKGEKKSGPWHESGRDY